MAIADDLRVPAVAYATSAALAVAAAVTAWATFVFGDVLTGTPVMDGSCRGTALVMLTVGVPILLAAMAATYRGSTRGVFVWFGMTLYLTYNTILIVIGTPMNRFFLLYEVTLTLALAAAIVIVASIDVERLAERCSPKLPARRIASYIWAVVALNALAWLGRIVPATVDDDMPRLTDGTGTSMVSTYFQDLAIWLPLLAVGALLLWRRRPWGFLLTGGALSFWAVESFTVAVDQWFGHRADPTSTIASAAAVLPFTIAGMVGIFATLIFLRHVNETVADGPPVRQLASAR